ncbi:MAG: flagellar export protein FliJ [Selenomonadaceae bacterium]|nr:flagellar export protein FliJ [Selenomonadaceae bacterium]
MKKFKFQLETLLKVTKRKKEDAEMQFAAASRKLEELREKLQVLLRELSEGQKEFADKTSEGKTINVYDIMLYNRFFNWKREQIAQQQKLILSATQEKQQRLKVLMKLITYLKSIEQLKEKRLREYNAELLMEEQKMLDEIGLQLHIRSS